MGDEAHKDEDEGDVDEDMVSVDAALPVCCCYYSL